MTDEELQARADRAIDLLPGKDAHPAAAAVGKSRTLEELRAALAPHDLRPMVQGKRMYILEPDSRAIGWTEVW